MVTKVVATFLFHTNCCCFCSRACVFILHLPLHVSLTSFRPPPLYPSDWLNNITETVKDSHLTIFQPPCLPLRPPLLVRLFTFLLQLCPHPCYHVGQFAASSTRGSGGWWRICAMEVCMSQHSIRKHHNVDHFHQCSQIVR